MSPKIRYAESIQQDDVLYLRQSYSQLSRLLLFYLPPLTVLQP